MANLTKRREVIARKLRKILFNPGNAAIVQHKDGRWQFVYDDYPAGGPWATMTELMRELPELEVAIANRIVRLLRGSPARAQTLKLSSKMDLFDVDQVLEELHQEPTKIPREPGDPDNIREFLGGLPERET